MIRHVVTWKLKEDNKDANAKQIKSMLENLNSTIDVIRFLEVGINENGGDYEVMLITAFDSFDDLKKYDKHPEHQKVREFVRSVVLDRVAVDYEIK